MKELITKEKEKIRNEYNSDSKLFINLLLIRRLFSHTFNILLTNWYLRSAQKNGRLIFTKKKPDIENQGVLEIGNIVRIWSNIRKCRLSIKPGAKLKIGNNCRLNGPIIVSTNSITIGNNCRIAPDVYIMDGDFHSVENRMVEGKSSSITIEDNVWVATRAMVMKGVTIGKGAVIAAGAVVTKNVEPYTLVGGVPAKFIRKIQSQSN